MPSPTDSGLTGKKKATALTATPMKRPAQKPKDTSRKIPHPDAETALKAAKKACREKSGRWFGRAEGSGPIAFWVYEDGKVVERHIVGR